MLLNTSWSHTSSRTTGYFGVSGSRIRHRDFPICAFFGHSLAAKFKFEFEKKMPYRESELGARRSNSCLVFVWQLECLNGNGPLRLFTGGISRRSEKMRTLSHFHTVDPCKKAVFACLNWHDERATRPYTHWHLCCCRKINQVRLALSSRQVEW